MYFLLEPWPAPTLNLAILFQSHGKTSPKDFHKVLLPFMANLTQYPDFSKHRMDTTVINYGKEVKVLKEFKGSVSINETKNVLLGLSKTLRSKSAVLCEAVEEALNSFQRLSNVKEASNQIVVITDTVSSDNCTTVLKRLNNADVKVQALQIGVEVEDSALESITDPKGGGFALNVESYKVFQTQIQTHYTDALAQNIIHSKYSLSSTCNTSAH